MRRRTLYCDCNSQIIDTTYEAVDLGLPSGILWANKNIGALTETDYGQYFQWGDVEGYTSKQITGLCKSKSYSWDEYKYSNNGGSTADDMTKYNSTDGKTVLEAVDDAAVYNMGGSWHMPTNANFNEILNTNNCTYTWVTDYNGTGINGCLFTSKSNSNTLFFPGAGSIGYRRHYSINTWGNYWCSNIYRNIFYAYNLSISPNNRHITYYDNRCNGYTVRGVIG